MSRAKLDALIDEMAARSEATARASNGLGKWTIPGSHHAGQAEAYAECARMLRALLAEYDSSRDPGQVTP